MVFYQKQFQTYSQSAQELEPELKSIDANILLEVFEMISDLVAFLISKKNHSIQMKHCLKDIL